MTDLIAVTGATGGIGGRVAAALAGRPLRLIVRDAARAPELGAEVAEATYADGDAMRAALEGAATVLLVSGSESADRVSEHLSAVGAAAEAGVGRIVYLSFMGAAPDATFTFARDHHATEEAIRATGVPFTFLRSCMYADYVPVLCGPDGVIRGPAGDGHVAPVARDDVAAAAAAVLVEPGAHAGATYDLTGRERFTLGEAAARIGARYEDETLEEAYASRAHYGAPDWEVEGWVTTYAAIAAGELDVVSDGVQRLTGREPKTLDDFT
jgi:uncharacterized protein YbjT (DUF2867 family)